MRFRGGKWLVSLVGIMLPVLLLCGICGFRIHSAQSLLKYNDNRWATPEVLRLVYLGLWPSLLDEFCTDNAALIVLVVGALVCMGGHWFAVRYSTGLARVIGSDLLLFLVTLTGAVAFCFGVTNERLGDDLQTVSEGVEGKYYAAAIWSFLGGLLVCVCLGAVLHKLVRTRLVRAACQAIVASFCL